MMKAKTNHDMLLSRKNRLELHMKKNCTSLPYTDLNEVKDDNLKMSHEYTNLKISLSGDSLGKSNS